MTAKTMIDTFVVISMDGIRREALTPFGVRFPSAPFPLTPALARLARNGVRFDEAFSASSWALAARQSLLTGLEPPRHGVRSPGDELRDHGERTVAALLASGGFATGYFSNGEGPVPDGFHDHVLGGIENESVAQWLVSRQQPTLLWFQEEAVSTGPESAESQLDRAAATDTLVAQLLRAIITSGRLERTLFVVVSDRVRPVTGSSKRSTPHPMIDGVLRVPLLLSGGPFSDGSSVASAVRTIDVVPTILSLAGGPGLDTDGLDLAADLEEPHERTVYAETPHATEGSWSCLRRDGWKLVWNRLTGHCQLWCPEADPDESVCFSAIHPELCQELADSLSRRERKELLVDSPRATVAHGAEPRVGLT